MTPSLKCPCCHTYSLTYDLERNGWVCHAYNAFIPEETLRRIPDDPLRRLHNIITGIYDAVSDLPTLDDILKAIEGVVIP